jgi:hypothetical protein
MAEKLPRKVASCVRCGATGDVAANQIGWSYQHAERCQNPPVTRCPDMKRATARAVLQAAN